MFRSIPVLAMAALLTTSLAGCQTTTGKTVGETMKDASISTAVQAKLTADQMSNFARVDVDTERGVVHLSGIVQSADHKAKAAELARQVEGVRRVDNNLQIQSLRP